MEKTKKYFKRVLEESNDWTGISREQLNAELLDTYMGSVRDVEGMLNSIDRGEYVFVSPKADYKMIKEIAYTEDEKNELAELAGDLDEARGKVDDVKKILIKYELKEIADKLMSIHDDLHYAALAIDKAGN